MNAEWGATFLHICGNSIGLIGNGLLLFLVLLKTPKPIKTYSILMFNFALTDFMACLTSVFVQQRLIPMGFSVAYVSNGPCKYFGPRTCFIPYSFMLHCYTHTLWSLLLSFLYRYYVLQSRSLTGKKLILILMGFYCLSFFQFAEFCFAYDDPAIIKNILSEHFPNYDFSDHTVTGNINIFEWKTLFTIVHMTVPITPVYCIIVFIRRRIIRGLRDHKLSNNTKAIHSQLLKALTFQAMLPGVFLIAVITYFIGQLGILNHPVLEYSSFILIGFLPTLSPIGTLCFIGPYHSWIRKNLFRRRASVASKNGASYMFTTTDTAFPKKKLEHHPWYLTNVVPAPTVVWTPEGVRDTDNPLNEELKTAK